MPDSILDAGELHFIDSIANLKQRRPVNPAHDDALAVPCIDDGDLGRVAGLVVTSAFVLTPAD